MSGNDHFTKAKSRLHNGTTNEVTRAQAEATLALAYEQRTANLIAMQSLWIAEGLGESPALGRTIIERLGLEATK